MTYEFKSGDKVTICGAWGIRDDICAKLGYPYGSTLTLRDKIGDRGWDFEEMTKETLSRAIKYGYGGYWEDGMTLVVEAPSNYNNPYTESELLKDLTDERGECGDIKEDTPMDSHYDNWYTLTEDDIKAGKIKIDPYFVYGMWSMKERDNNSCMAHLLKNLARNKTSNTREREVIGLYKTIKRMAELEGINLEG